jgi:site-specific recombinase XerD
MLSSCNHGSPESWATTRRSRREAGCIRDVLGRRRRINAGDHASRRFLDFFAASIENDNTRMAYYRAVCSFFAWLEQHDIGELVDIEPFHVAAYLKALRVSEPGDRNVRQRAAARPTVKQYLAAIRMLFDWLIVGQVLAINPAHAVRGPRRYPGIIMAARDNE